MCIQHRYGIGMSWWWTPEQRKEHEDYLQSIRNLTKECKKDPSVGMALLVKAGIYNEEGELRKEFGGVA